MKESSCHNAKMTVYYQEVCQLEDKPSVRYEEPKQTGDEPSTLGSGANRPSAPSDPKVMELDKDPATEPDPLAD